MKQKTKGCVVNAVVARASDTTDRVMNEETKRKEEVDKIDHRT